MARGGCRSRQPERSPEGRCIRQSILAGRIQAPIVIEKMANVGIWGPAQSREITAGLSIEFGTQEHMLCLNVGYGHFELSVSGISFE